MIEEGVVFILTPPTPHLHTTLSLRCMQRSNDLQACLHAHKGTKQSFCIAQSMRCELLYQWPCADARPRKKSLPKGYKQRLRGRSADATVSRSSPNYAYLEQSMHARIILLDVVADVLYLLYYILFHQGCMHQVFYKVSERHSWWCPSSFQARA